MTYVPSGIGAQIVAEPETTYGVAASLTGSTCQPYEFNSETLELKKTVVQGQGIHGGGLYNRAPRRVLTNYQVSGGINMDLPTRYLNQWLFQMFGSKGQTAATLTEDLTTGAYKATHAPGNTKGSSLTIQKGVPSVDGTAPSPFTYTGVKFTDWTISVATGAIASLAITVDGYNELAGAATQGDPLNASVPALATFSEAASNNVFHFREASLLSGGTLATASGITTLTGASALGNVKSAQIKHAFKMDTARFFLGSKGFKAEPIEDGFRDITGQFVVEWLNSEAMYEAFQADTPISLELSFVGPGIGTGSDDSSLTILIPAVYLEGESPKVGGPGIVTQTVPFTGLDNGTDNQIQATYWTLDTV